MDEHPGKGVPFERIRRITGYIVGTMDTWNNAKKAEERDRVKHQIKADFPTATGIITAGKPLP